MTQTNKAKQAGQENQETPPALTEEAVQKLLAPMMETVTQLKADKEQEAATQAAKVEAARQAQLNKDADLAAMLSDSSTPDDIDDKYEKMSKRQLVEIIAGAVETAMEANAVKIKSDISQSMSPNADKIAAMEKALMGIVGSMAVQECRNKFDDFDEYAQDISKIMGETGVGFEDAYYVAKSRRAGAVPPANQIDSEKTGNEGSGWENSPGATGAVIPNQSTLQMIADRGRKAADGATVTKSGTVGIRNIINAGVEKVVSSKK